MATALTGQGAGATFFVTDPSASAVRIIGADNYALPISISSMTNYTAGWLISAQNISGTAQAMDARQNGGAYGAGYWTMIATGGSASAAFYGSHNSADWKLITATALPSGTVTATGQWSGYYPYIAGVVPWVSGGATTGTVWLTLALF